MREVTLAVDCLVLWKQTATLSTISDILLCPEQSFLSGHCPVGEPLL